jgi:hypothetical protein
VRESFGDGDGDGEEGWIGQEERSEEGKMKGNTQGKVGEGEGVGEEEIWADNGIEPVSE